MKIVSMCVALLAAIVAAGDGRGVPVLNEKTGFYECKLPSEFQARPATVEILLPTKMDPEKKYPVVYILPVGGASKRGYGDGLVEAKKADVANKYDVICVSPYFTEIPWFGNHATKKTVRQEDHILNVLVPFIDEQYSTIKSSEGRWLIGFSKSGWGACTLLLRNPRVFGYAAAWDAPFMLNGSGKDWGPMGLKKNMGTKKQMMSYLPTALAKQNAGWLQERNRLVIAPGKFWKGQVVKYHSHLEKLKIPHTYRDDLVLKHRWDTGWFAPMFEELVTIARSRKQD